MRSDQACENLHCASVIDCKSKFLLTPGVRVLQQVIGLWVCSACCYFVEEPAYHHLASEVSGKQCSNIWKVIFGFKQVGGNVPGVVNSGLRHPVGAWPNACIMVSVKQMSVHAHQRTKQTVLHWSHVKKSRVARVELDALWLLLAKFTVPRNESVRGSPQS